MKLFSFSVSHVAVLPCLLLFASVLPMAGQEMAGMGHARAERSTMLTLTVNGASTQLTPRELASMPQTTLKVHNEHSNRDETYTGVAVADLLARAGMALSKETQTRLLHSYLRAQGTDFYFVLYSAAEVMPGLHDGSVIVATRMNGQSLGDDGSLKLVSSGDKKPARWVRNLTSLTLATLN